MNTYKQQSINSFMTKILDLRRSSPIILQKSVLTYRKAELAFFVFFSIWLFFSQIFKIHRTAGEGRSYLFISFIVLPPVSQTLRH